jgi:hypothetical protein
MALLVWISLAFLVVALVGSIATAAVRGLRLWRGFRAVSGAVSSALDDVSRRAAEAERRAVALGEHGEGLQAAVERLRESLAQLAVLRSAATDARATLFAFRGVVPRK